MRHPAPHRSTPLLAAAFVVAPLLTAAPALAAAPASVAAGAAAAARAAAPDRSRTDGPVPPAPVPEGEPIPATPAIPPPAPALTTPAPPPRHVLPATGDTWLDASHTFVENIFGTVLRFDRFFSDETDLDLERARSFLRWRNDVRYGEDTRLTFRTSLRADLKLPGLNRLLRRLRLVVSGETEDTLATLFPETTPTGTGAPGAEVGRANAELRYGIVDTLWTHVDLGGGVLLNLPLGVRGTARLRHAFPIGGAVLVRLGTTAFWETRDGWGDRMQVDLERRFGSDTVIRWQNGATISEVTRGWEWSTGGAVLQRLGLRTAVAAGGSVIGWTEPFPEVTQRRVFLRLRRDFFRRWLFYELEPEILWPVVNGHTEHRILGVIGRLEIQFHGSEMLDREADPIRARPSQP